MTLHAFARRLCGLRSDAGGHAEAIRFRLFDALVAAHIGNAIDDAGPLRDVLQNTLDDQIARWVAVVRSTEVDDIEIRGCVTAGSVVVPAALLAAKAWRADDKALLDAVLAGYEAMIGLARAIGGAATLTRGIWPTYVAAPFAVAATLARLKNFSVEQMSDALGLALARSAHLCGRASTGSSPRFLLLGLSAMDGVAAVRAAAAGYGGDPTVLASFLRIFDDNCAINEEDVPLLLSSEFKPYPTSRQGLAAIEAFRSIAPPERTADIDRVMVEVPSQTLAMLQAPPRGRIGSLVNLSCQLGRAVSLNGLSDCRHLEIPASRRYTWTDHIELRGAPDLDAAYPVRWGARVTLSMTNGATMYAERWGAPDLEAWPALVAKAESIFAASAISSERLSDLRHLCGHVAPGRSSADDLVALALQ